MAQKSKKRAPKKRAGPINFLGVINEDNIRFGDIHFFTTIEEAQAYANKRTYVTKMVIFEIKPIKTILKKTNISVVEFAKSHLTKKQHSTSQYDD